MAERPQALMKSNVEWESYFESFLELLGNSARLGRIPLPTGSQVRQLGHELLHLLALTQHLLPVGAGQCVGQPATLCHQPSDGSLAWTHMNHIHFSHTEVFLTFHMFLSELTKQTKKSTKT